MSQITFSIALIFAFLATTGSVAQVGIPTPPKQDAKSTAAPERTEFDYTRFQSVSYVTYEADDKSLVCDVYVPDGKGPFPAILMIHGGAWKSGTKLHMKGHAAAAAKKGFVAVSINYRHAPKYKWPAQNEDCCNALKWMVGNADKYKIDSNKIALWGYSAGGHMATFVATRKNKQDLPPLTCVVCGGGPVDLTLFPKDLPFLTYFLGATPRQAPEKYRQASPITHLSKKTPPLFFYHGEQDLMVPIEGVKNMVAKAKKLGVTCEFMTVPGKEHFLTFFDQNSYDRALEFIRQRAESRR